VSDEIKTDEVRELPHDEKWPGGHENTANILNEPRQLSEPVSDAEAKRAMFRKSRRGFLVGGAAALIGIFGWRWMPDETKYRLLRGTLEFNGRIADSLFNPSSRAPEFPPDRITPERVNGMVGLESAGFDPATWRLSVVGPGIVGGSTLALQDIKRLPRIEMITEFKCIEGWSLVQKWGGVRFSDLVQSIMPGKSVSDLPRYVSLTTPDEQYFVGWEIEQIMHPQTLLAYELNGQPLTLEHGAPLRLASPLKYGIKQIKRIGRIEFTDERPRDYWGEQGYDWYSGH
jgi:DMSO/TMAO reductase YedYZ molybdopterin-dependent catalytic subunit